jgi:hypothetical protein
MYIRFTLLGRNPGSNKKTGILVAANEFEESEFLSVEEHRELRQLLDWFNRYLPSPKELDDIGNTRALSWFRPTAIEAINKMWELKKLLEAHDFHTEVHKTNDPGHIIYRDQMQVLAKPKKGQKVS